MTRARRLAPGVALLAAGAVLAAALALVPVVGGPAWERPVGTIGVLAVLLYVAGVAMPWAGALPLALGLLAVEYLVSLQVRRAPLDAGAPTYAAVLFLCAELAWLGLEARRGGRPWPGRILAVAGLALAGAALGAVLLLLTSAVPLGGGPPMTALGVAATIAVAACLAWLGRRRE